MNILKRATGIILSAVMLTSVFAITAGAASEKDLTSESFNKKTGVLTISGKGSMPDYNYWYNHPSYYSYRDKVKKVVIKNGITKIGSECFKKMNKIKKVTIADSVKTIGAEAFANCKNLKSVKLGKNLKTIKSFAFYYCKKLKTIKLPDSVKTIGSFVFDGTAYYNNKKNWKGGAFYVGKHLCDTNDKMPADFKVKKGTVSIAGMTASNKVKSISIPASVTHIDYLALNYFENLKKLKVSKANKHFTAVDGVLYNKNKTKLIMYAAGKPDESFVIPKTVKKANSNCFAYSKNLKSVTIPGGLKTISDGMFSGCEKLSKVKIKKGVERIGEGAFSYCTSHKKIVLPEGFKELDLYCFEKSCNLESITIPKGVSAVTTSLEDIYIDSDGKNIEGKILTIIGYKGSRAQELAEDLEVIFQNIKTGEKTDYSVTE